jgi:hypothetical protein
LQVGGNATLEKIKAFLASGGSVIDGSGTYQFIIGSNEWLYTGEGGLFLMGIAPLSKVKSFPVSGGTQLGGSAILQKMKSFTASGGVQSGGVTSISKLKAFLANGGLQSEGYATTSMVHVFICTVSGGVQYTGIADIARIKDFLADGGIIYDGSGIYEFTLGTFTWEYLASGEVLFSGHAEIGRQRIYVYVGSGGIKNIQPKMVMLNTGKMVKRLSDKLYLEL